MAKQVVGKGYIKDEVTRKNTDDHRAAINELYQEIEELKKKMNQQTGGK